jgi:quercetin dioxygenase-like cupin family protein
MHADNPPPTDNPIGTALVFEDDRVRVWRIVLEPGEEAPWHTHELDYTSVSIEGDLIERRNADGTVDRIVVRPGAFTRWHQSTERHMLRNVGATRFANVIVELKGVPISFGEGTAAR